MTDLIGILIVIALAGDGAASQPQHPDLPAPAFCDAMPVEVQVCAWDEKNAGKNDMCPAHYHLTWRQTSFGCGGPTIDTETRGWQSPAIIYGGSR